MDRSPDMIDVHYLNELLNDRAVLESMPKRFMHLERILDQEIVNVRQRLFDCNFAAKLHLPEPIGEPRLHRKKVYIPDNGRHFNYVGRLLGPRGKTLKAIEQHTGCKVMIRGAGSARPSPPSSHGMFFGPSAHSSIFTGNGYMSPHSYGDDNDHLHIVIQCEDTPNRANVRISLVIVLIEQLFKPVDEANDELKQKQLLELSILRGTFKATTPRRSNVNLFNSFFGDGAPQNV